MMNRASVLSPAIVAEDRLFTLRNAHGMSLVIGDRGAAMVSWLAPDRYGHIADVLLGYPDRLGYLDNDSYFGAVVGRWANRIAYGRFLLDGVPCQLDTNDRGHHLHGGPEGLHLVRWDVTEVDEAALVLRTVSAAGAGGYPGKVDIQVRYRLDDDGSLTISYEAVTDAPTPLTLTVHPYFNLNGGSADVGDHMLQIDADHYIEIDESGMPLGPEPVGGSAFDFRQAAAIGPRLAWPDAQVRMAGGFDHCYCVRSKGRAGALREVARVVDPGSGRQLLVSTTEAGLQFYSGNALGGVQGRDGRPYSRHDGFCLEAHAWPDQINGPFAAAVILRPGQVYRQTTVYRLGVQP